jgi:hypothetical protein
MGFEIMNTAYEEFSEKYPAKLVVRGGMHLVPVGLCQDFVALCEKHSLRIIGVEGFRLSSKAIMPCEKYIADYSTASQSDATLAAKGFFSAVIDPEVHFEFVLFEEK